MTLEGTTKRFNGKRYIVYDVEPAKWTANKTAEKLRKEGHNARVVKANGKKSRGYIVYVCWKWDKK